MLENGGKKTFKPSEQIKKKKMLKKIRIYSHYVQMFSNMRPLLSLIFPQGFQKSKNLAHWTWGSGGIRPLKGVRNTIIFQIGSFVDFLA